MGDFRDCSFNRDDYLSTKEYTGTNALVLGVRNLLLSRPGNFPFNPTLGINIEKYKFELLDEKTISNIKTELESQIIQFMPSIDLVSVNVSKVTDKNGKNYLGISIQSLGSDANKNANFLLQEGEDGSIDILNEIN